MSNAQQLSRFFGLVVIGLVCFSPTNGRAAIDQHRPQALGTNVPILPFLSKLECRCSGAKVFPDATMRLALSDELRNKLKRAKRDLGAGAAVRVQQNFVKGRRSRALRSGGPKPLPFAENRRAEQLKLSKERALRAFDLQESLDIRRDLRDLLQNQQAQ